MRVLYNCCNKNIFLKYLHKYRVPHKMSPKIQVYIHWLTLNEKCYHMV